MQISDKQKISLRKDSIEINSVDVFAFSVIEGELCVISGLLFFPRNNYKFHLW